MPVVVHGAASTKDSAKNRAKLSKPNLEVLLSTSETAPGLLVGEFSYKGKLVTFFKKSEGKKASADTGVENEEVLNVPPVQEQIKPDVIVDLPPEKSSEEPKSEQAISPTGNVVFVSPEARIWFSPLWAQEKLEEVSQVKNILSSRENVWTNEKQFDT